MVKVTGPSGRLVEAVNVDFDAAAEPWETFELADGTVIKVRFTPTSITRFDGEFDQAGNPAYFMNGSIQVRIVKAKLRGQPTMTAPPQSSASKNDPSVG